MLEYIWRISAQTHLFRIILKKKKKVGSKRETVARRTTVYMA